MHKVIEDAVEFLDLVGKVDSLFEADSLSNQRIDSARSKLHADKYQDMDVVGFGSMARREMTSESDFDYLVLSTSLAGAEKSRDLLADADALRTIFPNEEDHESDDDGCHQIKPPGSTGVFGIATGAFGLIERIGLQDDTNHSLTRRVLVLTESVSLMNDKVHDEILRATIRRYLTVIKAGPERVPRFLLNDVMRYWRTIAVDYQAKALDPSKKPGLRNLKLRVPRKISYAGTLMSLLRSGQDGAYPATEQNILERLTMPPLARLLEPCRGDMDDAIKSSFRDVVIILNEYLNKSSKSDWRDKVEGADPSSDDNCDEFEDMATMARKLDEKLRTIFFEWNDVGSNFRKYLAF